eukprot:jgi/Mesvir1/11698/Mv25371-RA.1
MASLVAAPIALSSAAALRGDALKSVAKPAAGAKTVTVCKLEAGKAVVAASLAALMAAGSAEAATRAPFQESIRSLSGGYEASASGYNLTGTQKKGLSVSERKKVLAKVKAEAAKTADGAPAAKADSKAKK